MRPRIAFPVFRDPQLNVTFTLRETGSALPVQIPSLWAESGPAPRCLSPAIWKEETNFFAQPVFLFSRIWEFQQQQDSASERSRHPARAFSRIAARVG